MIFRFSEGFFNFKTVILSKLNFVRQTICQIIGICSLVKQAIFFVKGVLEHFLKNSQSEQTTKLFPLLLICL